MNKLTKVLLANMFLLLPLIFNAQTTKDPQEFNYYIELDGANNKGIQEFLEKNIQSKPEVTFFVGYGKIQKFYILKTNKKISKADFQKWISDKNLKVHYFLSKKINSNLITSKKNNFKSGIEDVPSE